jgi:CRISPR-associated protein Cas5t
MVGGAKTMDALKVVLESSTASFRVPYFPAFQKSLPVPPISTVIGIISCALGERVRLKGLHFLGYIFTYEGIAFDAWTAHMWDRSASGEVKYAGTNIITREVLSNARLTLYLPVKELWKGIFWRPSGILSLGRSEDLAYVEVPPKVVKLEKVSSGEVRGVLLPKELGGVGQALRLPIYFSWAEPRTPVATDLFFIIDAHSPTYIKDPQNKWLYKDTETGENVIIYSRDWLLSRLSPNGKEANRRDGCRRDKSKIHGGEPC